MRRILSESWTFIWQPNVLTHAVFFGPPLFSPLFSPLTSSLAKAADVVGSREGFLVRRIGVGAGFSSVPFVVILALVALLIVFLRFVDACSEDQFAGAFLDVERR